MTEPQTYTWAEAKQIQKGLPSYRQVDYWARLRVFGDDLTPGTGHDRHWTRRQLQQLAAIQTLTDDLKGIGLANQMPAALARRVWQALNSTNWSTLESGGVRIVVSIGPPDASHGVTVSINDHS